MLLSKGISFVSGFFQIYPLAAPRHTTVGADRSAPGFDAIRRFGPSLPTSRGQVEESAYTPHRPVHVSPQE
jgi:hypothetical protein